MCKKITLGVLGIALIAGLLFGGRIIPYTQTAIQNIRDSANDSVPVEFQLDTARNELKKIGPQIVDMAYQVAKEKVQIDRIETDIARQEETLNKRYNEMMTLRGHLESSDQFYVATNNKKYSRERVEEDLRHRFTMYQTVEATVNKQKEILRIRRESLESALKQMDQAKAQQRELAVQIENLTARNRMNEVVATANGLNIDSSQVSKTRQMLDDIDAKIAAREEVNNIAPKYFGGQIPVSEDQLSDDGNILEDMDAYFNKSKDNDNESSEVDFEL